MNTKCESKLCEKIIDRLIFSNLYLDDIPGRVYINFGLYRLEFEGDEKASLREACDYFKEQIALITKDWGGE